MIYKADHKHRDKDSMKY